MRKVIKTAIVEADRIRREQLQKIVERTTGFECAGGYETLAQAGEKLAQTNADVLLCAVDWFDLANQSVMIVARKKYRRLPVLILNIYHAAHEFIEAAEKYFSPPNADYALTPHELRVLELMVKGHHHTESARILNVSYNTIKFHVQRIYRKLEVNSKSAAVAKALRYRLIE